MRRLWGRGTTAGMNLERIVQKYNAGYATRRLHNRGFSAYTPAVHRRGMLVEAADVLNDGSVRLMFRDGASGQYHPMWLRLNCPRNSWAAWDRLTPMGLNDEQVQLVDAAYCSIFFVVGSTGCCSGRAGSVSWISNF